MRAMVIDKFEMCRSGLRRVLEDKFDNCEVCEAATPEGAVNCLNSHSADIILVTLDRDYKLDSPGLSKLREYADRTPIIAIGEQEYCPSADILLNRKFNGFVDKSNAIEITVAAIQLVMAGGQYFPPQLTKITNKDVAGFSNIRTPDYSHINRLTSRQREVLRAIAEGKSNKLIALELGISPGTVKVHVSNLMKALNAKNRTQAVAIANNLEML